jgi:hypothetical protein
MKINPKHHFFRREEDLRIKVLRKTLPRSYFKHKTKNFKPNIRDAIEKSLDAFVKNQKLIQLTNAEIFNIMTDESVYHENDEAVGSSQEIMPSNSPQDMLRSVLEQAKRIENRLNNYKTAAFNMAKRFGLKKDDPGLSGGRKLVTEKQGKIAKLLYL